MKRRNQQDGDEYEADFDETQTNNMIRTGKSKGKG